jgi:hypothetical protein
VTRLVAPNLCSQIAFSRHSGVRASPVAPPQSVPQTVPNRAFGGCRCLLPHLGRVATQPRPRNAPQFFLGF